MDPLPLDLKGAIGWTTNAKHNVEVVDEHSPIFEGKIPGLTGSLHLITHEAARSVLEKAGRSQDDIETTLTDRHVYLFELSAASQEGTPFLVAEPSAEEITVTAAVYNLNYFDRFHQKFHFYFEVEKTMRIKGQLGQFENYRKEEVTHPLRVLHSQTLLAPEKAWHKANKKEDESKAGTPERNACREAKLKAGDVLRQTYAAILQPYFKKEF